MIEVFGGGKYLIYVRNEVKGEKGRVVVVEFFFEYVVLFYFIRL